MCTVTWLYEPDGYQLFASRDELYSRGWAEPPRVFVRDGIRYIAPRDADRGGSWISVNEAGFAACLLNGAGKHSRATVSRGQLVIDLATSLSTNEAMLIVSRTDLNRHAPFTLALFEPGSVVMVIRWDGSALAIASDDEARMPLASSSFDHAGVQQSRQTLIERMRPRSAADFYRFHASHDPERGTYSPCMHRDNAATVSFTHVQVIGDTATLSYYGGPPCHPQPPVSVQLHASLHSDCAVHAG